MSSTTRRHFLNQVGTLAASGLVAQSLPSFLGAATVNPSQRLGFALVGLGTYSTQKLGPALKETKHCELRGVVTGSPDKATRWKADYGLEDRHVYSYETFDRIADDPAIDVVYVVLPNNLHAEYTIRALKAGKHVICEKPMAMDAKECREMISAARKAQRRLSIGYRMHYDPYFQEVKRLGQEKELGEVSYLECALGYYSTPPKDDWHMKKAMGGGSLYNLGVYPIQSARFTKGGMPKFVTAQATTTRKELFREVYETYTLQLEWEDGTIAHCYAGASGTIDRLFAACAKGQIELNPATGYSGPSGGTNKRRFDFSRVNQQALQMDDFARCVLEEKPSIVDGREGLLDALIIDAAHASIAAGGKRVEIAQA